LSLPIPDPTSFGAIHFGAAELGDRRRTRRLVHTVDLIVRNPGGSLPKMINEPAALDGLYRLASADGVTHQAGLEPHRQLTLRRMRDCEDVVLLIRDTTVLDNTTITSLHEDLGIVGEGRHSRGYLCHNTLAIEATSRQVLGLAHQILSCREPDPAGETRAQRRGRDGRESRLWSHAAPAVPAAPEEKTWVDACDRGADIFEYLDHKHESGGHYLVRSAHDRWVEIAHAQGEGKGEGEGEEGERRRVRLHDFARTLPPQGRKTVEVPARGGAPARTAELTLAAAAATLIPPRRKRGEHRRVPLPATVVTAREADPPTGADPVEWVLLTDLQVADLDDLTRALHWYGGRWVVEEYHKAMKTGCAIEALQFTAVERLQPVLALLSVVAVYLLQLR
jgi:hypothetical protein